MPRRRSAILRRRCRTWSAGTTSASTGSPRSPRSSSAWKLGKTHEELVDRAGALPALADRPHDERLAAAHVARGEDLRHRSGISTLALGRGLGVAARVFLHAELVEKRLHRRD